MSQPAVQTQQQPTITIAGHQTDLGQALQDHCEGKVEDLQEHFDHITDVNVTFEIERHRHLAELLMHANGIHMKVEGEGTDFYGAIDDATQKMKRRLERYKGRLRKHRNRRAKEQQIQQAVPAMQATHYQVEEGSLEEAPEDMFAEYMPKVVHQTVKDIPTASVDEAVMQMDLLHTNCYLFINAASRQLNVVYREKEGAPIGWIEPQSS